MAVLYTDQATGALDSSIGSSATEFDLVAGQGALFPAPSGSDFFYVRIGSDANNEVVKCTARSTDTVTCEATANAWSAGTEVSLVLNKLTLDEFLQKSGGTLTGNIACDDKEIQKPELKDYAETSTSPSSSSGTLTLDIENGNVFDVTLTENVTTTNFNNPSTSGKGCSFTLILTQDGTGGWAVTWPASVDWAAGTAPTLTSAAGSVDVLTFITVDGGTTWLGFVAGQDLQ